MELIGADKVKALLASLDGPEARLSIQMALNKTASKGRAAVNREVLARYAIRAEDVRNSVTVRPANRRQAVAEAFIEIFGSPSRRGRSMNLIHFLERSVTMAEVRRRGKAGGHPLHFKFLRAGGKKAIKGAFVWNKGRTVFESAGGRKIKAMQMIGVSQMFNSKAVSIPIMAALKDIFVEELARSVQLTISKR